MTDPPDDFVAYLPELAALDEAQMPAMSDYGRWLGAVRVTPVPVPGARPRVRLGHPAPAGDLRGP